MIDQNDPVARELPKGDPRWLELLRQAVKGHDKDGRGGVTRVAAKLGRHRSYISQFINGCNPLPASPNFQRRVMDAFGNGRLDCPHLKTDIAQHECHSFAAITWGQVVNTGYDRLDHWRACDVCPNNPANQRTTNTNQPAIALPQNTATGATA